MVSEHSTSNSNSSILHQFIISNSIANQNQFQNHHFDAYAADSLSNNTLFPHSVSSNFNHCLAPQLSPDESNIGHHHNRRLMDLLGTSNDHHAANPTTAQRLSLSLGDLSYRQRTLNSPMLDHGGISDYSGFAGSAFAPPSNQPCRIEPFSTAIGSSKYLKQAQSLLEEMVSVGGKEIDSINVRLVKKLSGKGSYGLSSELHGEFSGQELTTEEHGAYLNLLKLLALLEEVERRYDEYYHHMEELVSSFEAIAGLGAGKSYTSLALQAMSKHFFSLRKAIVSQIRATKQKIEKDAPKISSRLSQLSLFDQESRQNRLSLQQIGIMHNSRQAWRPIRGLPENSVTVLRAWLFEHFLHPYPNDSEKSMLASQTGLSKNQVSNWFINARVRLWKPMIEEMYKEEFAESSIESDQLLTREGVGDSAEDLD